MPRVTSRAGLWGAGVAAVGLTVGIWWAVRSSGGQSADAAPENRSAADKAERKTDKKAPPSTQEGTSVTAREIFNRRILPIMNSPRESSCTQCHLSGVELKNYIHSDQATTFAALKRDGWIDLKNPDDSKILRFIARKPEKSNPISDKVRQQEYAAFRAWLREAVKDPSLLKATAADTQIGTKLPPDVIRHARKDRVLSSFIDNIWSQMGRCISCHSPNNNQRLVKKHGEQMSWIVPHNPQGTLDNLVEGGNIDTDHPENSPVLTKPAGLEKHGGGPKFLVGGPAYRGFLRFLTDYAAIVNGKYQSKADLPAPPKELVLLSRQHLRILNLPAGWDKLPLRVDLYRWDERRRRWSEKRWGTAFGPVNGKRHLWQNIVAVTAPAGSPREKEIRQHPLLPTGRYLAKLYLDREKRTQKNPDYELGRREFIGQVEFRGPWPIGYRTPKIIHRPHLRD